MTKPSDISDEVWQIAEGLLHAHVPQLRELPLGDEWAAAFDHFADLVARALSAAEKRGMERAAKIAEDTTNAPGQRNAKDLWVEQIGQRVAAAIRSEG